MDHPGHPDGRPDRQFPVATGPDAGGEPAADTRFHTTFRKLHLPALREDTSDKHAPEEAHCRRATGQSGIRRVWHRRIETRGNGDFYLFFHVVAIVNASTDLPSISRVSLRHLRFLKCACLNLSKIKLCSN